MLIDEFNRLAMSVDYLHPEQVDQICSSVLNRLLEDAGGIIADIWVLKEGVRDTSVLERRFHSGEGPQGAQQIAISPPPEKRNLLSWVAEKQKPLLLEDIHPDMQAAINKIGGEIVGEEYLDIHHRTRGFAAVPIVYRSLRAVLSLEVDQPDHLNTLHTDLLGDLVDPIGKTLWKLNYFIENKTQTDTVIRSFTKTYSSPPSKLYPYKTGFFARRFEDNFKRIEVMISQFCRDERICARSYAHQTGGTVVIKEITEQIRASHFGIVDISDLNLNVLIEFGIMLGADKEAIILRRRGGVTDLPFDIRPYYVHEYEYDRDSVYVHNQNGRIPLDRFIRDFRRGFLARNKAFRDAKDWRGESF